MKKTWRRWSQMCTEAGARARFWQTVKISWDTKNIQVKTTTTHTKSVRRFPRGRRGRRHRRDRGRRFCVYKKQKKQKQKTNYRVLEDGCVNSFLKPSCSHWVPSEVWTRVSEKRRVFASSNVFDKQSRDGRIRVLVSSKSKNPKPTSGHLKVRNLNQPLDTTKIKVKATTTHKKCPEVVLDFFATRVDEAKQEK